MDQNLRLSDNYWRGGLFSQRPFIFLKYFDCACFKYICQYIHHLADWGICYNDISTPGTVLSQPKKWICPNLLNIISTFHTTMFVRNHLGNLTKNTDSDSGALEIIGDGDRLSWSPHIESRTKPGGAWGAPMHIWQCLETLCVVTTGGGATGIWWVEARVLLGHSTMHRTVSTTKNYCPKCEVQNLSRATLEKLGTKPIWGSFPFNKNIS